MSEPVYSDHLWAHSILVLIEKRYLYTLKNYTSDLNREVVSLDKLFIVSIMQEYTNIQLSVHVLIQNIALNKQ